MAKKQPAPPAVTDDPTNTAQTSTDAPAPPAVTDDAPLPVKLVLTSPYGFIDESEKHRYWHTGTEVTDADDIALLLDRGAPVQEPEEV